jgi:hypothetical protein
MGTFVEMDPEVAARAIEGYDDVLSTEVRKQDAFHRQFSCANGCGQLQKEYDAKTCFPEGGEDLLARALLRCPICGYLIDPETRIILEQGNPLRGEENLPIIGG